MANEKSPTNSNAPEGAPLKFILVRCIPCYHNLLSQCAGKGERTGRHIRAQGHQEEARGGQPAGRAHSLGEEDSIGGSLAFCCQVSPVSDFEHASIYIFFICLLSFYSITIEAPWQIVAFQLDRMAGDVKMSEMRICFFF